ncbi:riboflavin synthase subunit alpha [Nocardioides sp. Soil797]|nr:riboflavin synthase subunit alpha [Nocardioides sp. Soil797]
MFTGIIEELGTVEAIEPQGDAIRLSIRAGIVLEGTGLGDSIAVNGCCLTVTSVEPDEASGRGDADEGVAHAVWTADVMQETLDKTSLLGVGPGDRVNLERAVTVEKRLGGHIVQGHVDGVGTIVSRTPSEHWELVEIRMPAGMGRYLVDKGSITVDGISLTVVETHDDTFTISLIPETLSRTTLGFRAPGDRVNLEADIIAKHVEKLLASGYVNQGDSTNGGPGHE